MRKLYKIIDIEDPIYNRLIQLGIGSKKAYSKYMLEFFGLESDMEYAGSYEALHSDDRIVHVMWVESLSKIEDIPILAHEVLHLTFDVLKEAGFKYCDGCEEAYTYYFQMILNDCLTKNRDIK